MPKVFVETPGLAQMVYLAAILLLALLLLYLGIVLMKGRGLGARGDHMRMVDSISLTPTSRLALVEIEDGDVYLLSVTNDRIDLVDRLRPGPAVDRIQGRPPASPPPPSQSHAPQAASAQPPEGA